MDSSSSNYLKQTFYPLKTFLFDLISCKVKYILLFIYKYKIVLEVYYFILTSYFHSSYLAAVHLFI